MGDNGTWFGWLRGWQDWSASNIYGYDPNDPTLKDKLIDPNWSTSQFMDWLSGGIASRSVAVIIGVAFVIIAIIAVVLTSNEAKTVIANVAKGAT